MLVGRSVVALLLLALALAFAPTGILGEPQEGTQQWIFFRPPANASSNWDYGVLANRFDFRGSYKFFGLLVGSYDDVLVLKTLYPTSQAYAFALYNASEHLWVAECEARFGSVLATEVARALLAAHIPVLKTYKDQSGWMAFIIKGPDVAALHQFPQVVLVPVPRRAQVAALPFEATTLHKLFATGMVESPLKKNAIIAKLITDVSKERLRKNVEHLSSYFTRLSTSQPVREAQAWIARQYAMLGLDVSIYPFKEGFSDNVIAEMRGAVDPSKIVIVSGHYDSRSVNISDPDMRAPGADDNGSGTSNVLELARVFTQSGLKFRHTIRFCSWSGEEQGLVGSRVYAQEMRAQNVDIIAVLNSDMLGWTLPDQPVTLGMKDRYVTPELLWLANNLTQLYVPDLPVGSSPSCCSDHQSFYEQGYPAVGYFENPGSASDYPHYHKSTDLPEYLNFDQMVLISRAIGAAVATVAVPL